MTMAPTSLWRLCWNRVQELARAKQQKEAGVVPRRRRQQDRNLSVRALARPEPDIEKLAQVLINIALTKAKAEGQHGR